MNVNQLKNLYAEFVEYMPKDSPLPTITGGGALVMLGLRDGTTDLDINISDSEVYEYLKEICPTSVVDGVETVKFNDLIDIHYVAPVQRTIVIDGVAVLNPEELMLFKMNLVKEPARNTFLLAQDRADVLALSMYLVQETSNERR